MQNICLCSQLYLLWCRCIPSTINITSEWRSAYLSRISLTWRHSNVIFIALGLAPVRNRTVSVDKNSNCTLYMTHDIIKLLPNHRHSHGHNPYLRWEPAEKFSNVETFRWYKKKTVQKRFRKRMSLLTKFIAQNIVTRIQFTIRWIWRRRWLTIIIMWKCWKYKVGMVEIIWSSFKISWQTHLPL